MIEFKNEDRKKFLLISNHFLLFISVSEIKLKPQTSERSVTSQKARGITSNKSLYKRGRVILVIIPWYKITFNGISFHFYSILHSILNANFYQWDHVIKCKNIGSHISVITYKHWCNKTNWDGFQWEQEIKKYNNKRSKGKNSMYCKFQ
jgi:hypothetical protein